MKIRRWSAILCLSLLCCAGCASSATPSSDPLGRQSAAQRPNPASARSHLEKHVNYPASRAQILAACAHTKEFSDAEKQWFAESLPEGTYRSARHAAEALHLEECHDNDRPSVGTCSE
jgi:hypothetical protein